MVLLEASPARRVLAVLASVAIGLLILTGSSFAQAQGGKAEATARALQKKAMEEDYLGTEFAKAQTKLEQAVTQCGTDKCSPGLRSRLKRDLGVVQIGGALDREKGIGNFVEAIKLDPTVALEPDFKTKDLDAAFAEAKKRATGGGTAPPPPETPAKPAAPSAGGQPQGDFSHTPAIEQTVRTPIPVYVEYNGEETLVRVIARYKGFGMTEWKTVELKKTGEKGWGAVLPCGDVQTGNTLYYLQGFNANNDPVATGGDRNNPYKVPVVTEKVAEPPHLPNASPPTQCADTGDCPPNFPGCKKAGAAKKEPTAEGAKSSEPEGKDGGEFCEDDTECKSGSCKSSKCTDYEGKKGARFWVGISGGFDYTFVPSSTDVCKLTAEAFPTNTENYYCVRSDGADYPSRDPSTGKAENDAIVPSEPAGSDKVNGGGALGNVRILLSFDYAISGNFMLGARLGLVLNNYPGEAAGQDGKRFAAPIHLELRGTYVFGDDPIFKKGFAPYVMGAAGIAQFESKVPVQVFEQKGAVVEKREVDAWHISGPAFVALGGGGRLAISPKFAFMFGLRANFAFLNAFAPSVGPEIGGQLGF